MFLRVKKSVTDCSYVVTKKFIETENKDIGRIFPPDKAPTLFSWAFSWMLGTPLGSVQSGTVVTPSSRSRLMKCSMMSLLLSILLEYSCPANAIRVWLWASQICWVKNLQCLYYQSSKLFQLPVFISKYSLMPVYSSIR